jgi:integrase
MQRLTIIPGRSSVQPPTESLEDFLRYRATRIGRNFHRDTALVLRLWLKEIKLESVEDCQTEQLQTWFDHKCQSVKLATAASYLTWIRVYFDWVIRQGVRSDNPALGVEVPRFRKPFRKVFVSKSTVQRLLDNCRNPELKYCLYCGFHAGLRFSEVVMSRPAWFDLTEGLLHVTRFEEFETKDGEDRSIPLTDDFLGFLRVYGFRAPYMIGNKLREGKRYRFTFRTRFLSYVKKEGVAISFHDCRRTFASLHASHGTSIFKIAKWLGDGVQVVERHYGHLTPADRQINDAF